MPRGHYPRPPYITVTCRWCGTTKTLPPSKAKTMRYCGIACRDDSKRKGQYEVAAHAGFVQAAP